MSLLGRLRNVLASGAAATDIEAALRLHERRRLDEAEAIYRKLLAHEPQNPHVLHLLGLLALQRDAPDAARELLARGVAIDPASGLRQLHLGNALRALGRSEEAVAAYRRAVELDPHRFDAWLNLGQTCAGSGHGDEAIAAFRRAVALAPADMRASTALAAALVRGAPGCGEPAAAYAEAVALLETGWSRASDPSRAQLVLAKALEASGRWTEAAAHLESLLAKHRSSADLHLRLARSYDRLGRAAEAVREYRATYRFMPNFPHALSSVLGALHAVADVSPEEVFEAHREWAQLVAAPLYPAALSFENDREPGRRLRIGYVSPHLRRHPVGTLFAPVLEHHDRTAFETYCYHNHPRADAMTERVRRAAAHWRDVADLDDATLAERIRADRIDVLVDLAGHTARTRLGVFARRGAPVQVSWLGYWSTTGLATMDYFVTDPHASPPGQERYFVEALERLPATRWCYVAPESMPAVNPLPAGQSGPVTFGCFQRLAKLNVRVLELWARILAQVPGAQLVLQADALRDPIHNARIRTLAVGRGIPSERLVLRAPGTAEEGAAGYRDIDIALDPFPFCGGMASLEALWMGVPVVTLPQATIAGRETTAVLANLGLDELVAADEARYLEIAVGLARDLARLAALRAGLRERFRASPLADAARFTRDLEAAYRGMWEKWVNGSGRV